jgi:light-regulated signal transduction histidine kinase (bacteriophytochrome)
VLDFDGAPLDLSHSGLRAVSPIHIEYLRNMGVKASMSVSILRNGELWGLFACHHYSPLTLPYGTRTAAELFGEFFSGALEQMEIRKALTQRDTATHLHDALMAQVANGGALLANFDRFADLIRQVIPFDGIVGYVAGDYVARGDTPAQRQFLDLARFLNTTGNGACWSTHHLAQVYPPPQGSEKGSAGCWPCRCRGCRAISSCCSGANMPMRCNGRASHPSPCRPGRWATG